MDENVEYEEREDEFDIVSLSYNIVIISTLTYSVSCILGRRAGAATKKNES